MPQKAKLAKPQKQAKTERRETDIQKVINYYFATKGLNTDEVKMKARQRVIVYSRHTKPAKQLLELAGSFSAAKKALNKVAKWAKSRRLDYTIETVLKKWLELDKLIPKKPVRRAFFRNQPMVWSEAKKKWFVVTGDGEWLNFAGQESDIEWREGEAAERAPASKAPRPQ